MSLELTSLDTLDVAAVQAQRSQLQAAVAADNPTLDLRRGPVSDILLEFEAQLAELTATNNQRIQNSSSLLAITADPTLADETIVDAVLSNYGLVRGAGSLAAGAVTLIVNGNTTVTIGQGAVFASGVQQFTADESYSAKADASLIVLSADRLLQPLGDGTFAFTINVTAVTVGSASRLTKNTILVPSVQPVTFVKSYASADFIGGLDVETNEQLLARQQEGIATKALSGPVAMNAAIRAVSTFENIVTTAVVGMGDGEMLRDMHTIFPLHFGGKIDWYIRSEEQARTFALTKLATLIATTTDGHGIWQFALGRDEVPGFYDVTSVLPLNSTATGTLEILADVRGVDLSAISTSLIPDIANAIEGAYSRFQTAVIQFKDTVTPTTGMVVNSTTANYAVAVRGLSLIEQLHDYVASNGIRFPSADILVKAPVPCFLQLSFTIFVETGDATPDLDAIRTALAQTVNRIPFVGRLMSSKLFAVIHSYLAGDMTVGAIDMFGRIRRPNGTFKYLRNSSILTVPDEPANMVTERTTQFFISPSDISISVQTVAPPET